ncbi:MurR/RpiR family transcriptional regulator [Rhizobium sp. MC63]|uniref:MurR/RpiR family transcriptional regulator n=1 Tax=Rhizobium mulingense TaxID=3031128 RepID=A0ACC6N484_9HYPH|nr:MULTISPECIES: MurR/RpiR family transcriptional regulator [unclassified Rhizobium]MDF0698699.1 MurR/RpiR family transcriptional regulator [Rhizobium sp. MC63]MEA3520295.1 MurR/RpiR family transcriptional regulator [Rhizobium sp. MJ31]MEB3045430.1 MurR/RpiR family transcriptional regulator [Rhizobium sp. MJ21]
MLKDRNSPPSTLQELKHQIARRQLVFPVSLERVAREILERPDITAFESAAAVARRCRVSPATVHRLVRHIGFETFGEFRAMIRQHLCSTAASHH